MNQLPDNEKPVKNIDKVLVLFFWMIITEIFLYLYANNAVFHFFYNIFFDWCTAGTPTS